MKLAFTIADAGHALHVGGQTTAETYIVDVPDLLIPKAVQGYLANRNNPHCFWSMSVSVIVEKEHDAHDRQA